MIDVTALGELLVDFCEVNTVDGIPQFAANPGGAPCNVLAYLAKHGRKTAFIGRVGDDLMGQYLRDMVVQTGIDVSGLTMDPEVKTTLAFVRTDAKGERSFSFFRNPGADCCLTEADVDYEKIAQSRVFHFGTLSMTHDAPRAATKKAVEIAKQAGALISFDPNYRPLLWESEDLAREQMAYGCSVCDFLKIEREELYFLTGIASETEAVQQLLAQYPIKLLTVTAGEEGAALYYNDIMLRQGAVPVAQPVDTTGAGDAFCAGCIDWLLTYGMENLTEDSLRKMLLRACTGASIVIGRKGALLTMPTREEIDTLMQ